MTEAVFIHDSASVETPSIGEGSRVWQYVVILEGAQIGSNANICSHCLIENDVVVGDNVTVKSGVQLWDGLRVENNVFIGPNVTFTNDKYPRSKHYPEQFLTTTIAANASIGAGAVILPGVTIGTGAMVGAGAVVTKSVPPFAVALGSPARITGYVNSQPRQAEDDLASKANLAEKLLAEKVVELGVGKSSVHRLDSVTDMRGNLSAAEFPNDIPFLPQRFFLVFNVPSKETRGEHAHYQCDQFLVCVKGSCSVVVDDGKNRAEVTLDSPDVGVYLPALTWGIQYKYSEDAVLMVMASDHYDPDDYIRDYDDYLRVMEGHQASK